MNNVIRGVEVRIRSYKLTPKWLPWQKKMPETTRRLLWVTWVLALQEVAHRGAAPPRSTLNRRFVGRSQAAARFN